MSIYVKSLFFAIPTFFILIIIEMIVARAKGLTINNSQDMMSSLSSGMTNIIKDVMKFGFAIISYSWFVENLTIYKIEPTWLAVLVAFIIQDFGGYWTHRFSHRINLFWNRHIIHHSSEEFNLSCALRQSISQTFKFFTFLWIPAALMGIPSSIFAILAPIHLFLQFWYHTKLINKMGMLEHILVTPSHHRVHHAINSEYIDKNYGQIFIVWDKLFGTFQPELDEVKPVYGTLRPSSTWNPILINFKHLAQLIKDAWNAEKIIDKLKIWFMPTGWRPLDVYEKHPLQKIEDPYSQVKYKTNNSFAMISWAWIQFGIGNLLMLHFLLISGIETTTASYIYAILIFTHIFSFTAMLDNKQYAIIADILKMILGICIIYYQNFNWYGLGKIAAIILIVYFFISLITTSYFYNKSLVKKIC